MDLYTYDIETFSVTEGCMPIVSGKPARTFWEQFPPSTSPSLRSNFTRGVRLYFDGDWSGAAAVMEECLDLCPGDRPSHQILDVMRANDFVAPVTWRGHREVKGDSWEVRKIVEPRNGSFATSFNSRSSCTGSHEGSFDHNHAAGSLGVVPAKGSGHSIAAGAG